MATTKILLKVTAQACQWEAKAQKKIHETMNGWARQWF